MLDKKKNSGYTGIQYTACLSLKHSSKVNTWVKTRIISFRYYVSIMFLFTCNSLYLFFLLKMLLTIYRFSNSQSKSVILHRMYFHCRSLEQSTRHNPVSSTLINNPKFMFSSVFIWFLPMNCVPMVLTEENVFFPLGHEGISTIFCMDFVGSEVIRGGRKQMLWTNLSTPVKVVWAPRMK